MSSEGHLQSQSSASGSSKISEIDHQDQLSENFSTLCMNMEYSDIVLVVQEQKLSAHKVVLAARSEYFRALLYGGMRESNQAEITLSDAPVKAFKSLLKYIYTGRMCLAGLKEDTILDILGLSHQYGFQELECAISNVLKQMLALKNVCSILDMAQLFGLKQLVNVCLDFIDKHSIDVLNHKSFLLLSQTSMVEILQRDSFFAPEIEVFKGACNWCKHNQDFDDLVIKSVRLHLLQISDILAIVRPSGFLHPDALLDAIQKHTTCKPSELPYRGLLVVDENVASSKNGAKVITGETVSSLLDGNYFNYDMERGYTRHAIDDSSDGITVKLASPYILNHIRMLLWDRDLRSYSYYIEASMDQKDWVRIVNYSNFSCRSWQKLYFKSRVVQYFRIVGTHNTVNKIFHLVTFEAFYKEKIPELVNDMVCPSYNVATMDNCACVIEGVSRSRNALLNGDTQHYDWDSGYTCHQLGSGAILVQLGQPYILSSLRLLLWDCDERTYSYYIESSVNIWDWEILVDRSREHCRSWQEVSFSPRPIVYIRIVGTLNSANEVFHCVHLECPNTVLLKGENEHTKKPKEAFARGQMSPDIMQPTETATEADESVDLLEPEEM